jgi:hypothetical protein
VLKGVCALCVIFQLARTEGERAGLEALVHTLKSDKAALEGEGATERREHMGRIR